MLVNITHLEKHLVFAALYNFICDQEGSRRITLDQAKSVIDTYQANVGGRGPLFFDYIDVPAFLKKEHQWGAFMKIDISGNIICSARFDERYGERKVLELMLPLYKEKKAELHRKITPCMPTQLETVFGTDRKLEVLPNLKELIQVSGELACLIQDAEMQISLNAENKKLITDNKILQEKYHQATHQTVFDKFSHFFKGAAVIETANTNSSIKNALSQ